MLPVGTDRDLPHLAGPAASIRQVLAAYFLRDCQHVLEIGGHDNPITRFLVHNPLSVLSVDPKTEPLEARELNGKTCHVRHLACKFQQVDYDYQPRSYGLVMLGFSLKGFGEREPLGELLYSLIDNARIVVIEFALELERATSQIPAIVSRPGLRQLCRFEIELDDDCIAGSPYARRCFLVLEPAEGGM